MISEDDANKARPEPKLKAIDETISTERAWQVGRRIYIRCAYESKLGVQLREIGANWDREQRRLWVGSGKRDKVIPLVQAADARARAVDDIKNAGRWVSVPYEATEIRAEVKKLDGVFDGDRKAWAMPSEESHAVVQALVAQYRERLAAAKQAAKEKRRQEEKAAREAERAARREQLLAESGRSPTGESVEHRAISTRRMNKATAWDTARPLGELMVLGDGRRGIIVNRKVWFTNSEFASSTCWHPETHDTAHWDFAYTLALVEPTAEERAADAEQAARIADAAALHRLLEAVARSDHGERDSEFSAIPEQQRAGEIRCSYGTVGRHDGGRLILTTRGELIYQHPGYYDDYRHSQRTLPANNGLVDQARALIDQGPRKRVHSNQMFYDYEVIVTPPGGEPDASAADETVTPTGTSDADQVPDTGESAEPADPTCSEPTSPEAGSTAARVALDLVASAADVDEDLAVRLATAIEYDEATIEEFSDEDRFLSAQRGVEATLTRYDFTLPDGQVISLWAVVDVWWEVYEDVDADSTTTVYLAEPEARARWRERVAEHQDSPPRTVHPEFDEPDDEFSDGDSRPGPDAPHRDQYGSTTASPR